MLHYTSLKIFVRVLLMAPLVMLFSDHVQGQTLVTAPMTGTPTPGPYYHTSSITLSPNFYFTATPGNSLHLYISGEICNPLQTVLSPGQNYVVTYLIKKAGITTPADPNRQTCEVQTTVQYFDGLGRPLQTVQVKGNQDGTKDLIQPVAYDQFGREAIKYLPYTTTIGNTGSYRSDALTGAQQSFYHPNGTGNSGDQLGNGLVRIPTPYAATVFEPSPLDRITEQGAPGNDWQPGSGHTVRMSYGVNNNADAAHTVRVYTANVVGTTGQEYKRNLISSGNYTANELTLTEVKDENWQPGDGLAGPSYEFKDKEGRVVIKRVFTATETLSTYYVYDDLGNLCFVIPPGANPDNGGIDQVKLDTWCYQYRYDGRKRLIEKKIPGKGWEFTIYNAIDQVVATQDSLQRIQNPQQWAFTKYDGLGRVAYSGLWRYIASTPGDNYRTALQGTLDGQTTLWETQITSGTGYSGGAWPQSNILRYLTLNYYDSYTFPNKPYNPTVSGTIGSPKGLLTATKTAVLEADGSYGPMLWTVNYYDDESKLVQSMQQHYLGGVDNTGNYDEINSSYSFTGELTGVIRHHYVNSVETLLMANRYTYDHMGRKTESWQKMNSDAEVLLSRTEYNELGQLTSKSMHGGLQSTAYTYNERGWLKGLNSAQFSMQLHYQDAINSVVPQWNGNISNQVYNNDGSNTFDYSYDKLNRLISGVASNMSEVLSYDVMGNIQNLTRDGVSRGYSYQGNQLQQVSGLTTGTYLYDGNGNARFDARNNKTISYNFLGLPATVSGGPAFTYSATGQKLKKISGSVTTEYISGIQYTNGSIEFVQTEDGIARRTGNSYSYEYNLNDHLGNVRATFKRNPITGNLEVIQRDNYYSFGLRKTGTVGNDNKYLYNGKELQEELGQYDYGARFYDPVIGRWTSIDPLGELGRKVSPYTYVSNNPTRHVDPDGMWELNINGTGFITTDPKEIFDVLSRIKHGENYYNDRRDDFIKRNPGKKAPDYYMNYGNKYLKRFKYQTRGTLSKAGKKWLDNALLNLQIEMDAGIESNPNIENNNEAFMDLAFDTHVKAYEDAGILDLDVMDKVRIMLTVDPEDLFSERGVKQAITVATDQALSYVSNPVFAAQQYMEALNHQLEIKALIFKYAVEHLVPVETVSKAVYSIFRK